MAVVLVLAAAVGLLVLTAFVGPGLGAPWFRVVYVVILWVGPFLLVVLAVLIGRRHATSRLQQALADIAGPALIGSMSPRAALGSLLPRVYGKGSPHEDVLVGVLGGSGRDPAGSDTAVSRGTTAYFRLRAIDEFTSDNDVTWTHDFSGVRNNHTLVVFATSDPVIAGLIPRERVFPLFELWLMDEDHLEDFVPILRENARIGISYIDVDGFNRKVDPTPLRGEEVAVRDYGQFVRLPESLDRKNVRIVQFDLYDLVDPDHVVESIETLSFRVSVRNSSALGYVTWSPPHPCFVHKITFDVEELPFEGQRLAYLVLTSTLQKAGLPTNTVWEEVSDRIEVKVESWMLPGHAVTLLWRPLDPPATS
ncbi:hypothetical protein [Pseudonocardia alaniniphila]|uniref:Uncharacterized protein n=1 Tax=Pseudonocardia alaniniphila TaxID=75291 RepID=A0ABS9TE80_9PSEU|nr:hypothetical protein [Pseudonocardia alaniniphila]MCH6166856.1 hypothetical protein [Pseudonocardia alaniniphila]